MAYTALYRKKRPKTFEEVVGQPHVVRTLLNQLKEGHISHAYLFCGTRGTGKTSTARLFSRAVNCEHPRDGEPCNECDVCRGILAERNLGVIEIDAASNNGVDNIRDLREEVKYPPTEGRYKVYIVDEAHMLTGSAFNALLKTLEEPPAHVIFILATTDAQKVPATILSRCQRYDFKRLSVRDTVDTIKRYLQDENAEVEDEALRYIASVSDGAMRDALSILDQCLSFYSGERITLERVLSLLGAVDRRTLYEFTDALSSFDSGRVLTIIDVAVRDGRDISQLTGDLIKHFRDLLVAARTTGTGDILDLSAETVERLRTQSGGISTETLIGYIRTFSELQNELRYTANARMVLEVCAIRLCNPTVSEQTDAIFARLERLERMMAENPVPVERTPQPKPLIQEPAVSVKAEPPREAEKPKRPAPAPKAAEKPVVLSAPPTTDPALLASTKQIEKGWADFSRTFSFPLKSMLPLCTLESANGLLRILCNDEASMRIIKEKQSLIQEKLAAHFNLSVMPNLAFGVGDGYNKQQTNNETNNASKNEVKKEEPDAWASFGDQVDMDAAW